MASLTNQLEPTTAACQHKVPHSSATSTPQMSTTGRRTSSSELPPPPAALKMAQAKSKKLDDDLEEARMKHTETKEKLKDVEVRLD